MDKYTKLITIADNDYEYFYKDKLLELLELIKTRKKNILHVEILDWLKTLKRKELERFALDVYNVQLMEIFADICQMIYSI